MQVVTDEIVYSTYPVCLRFLMPLLHRQLRRLNLLGLGSNPISHPIQGPLAKIYPPDCSLSLRIATINRKKIQANSKFVKLLSQPWLRSKKRQLWRLSINPNKSSISFHMTVKIVEGLGTDSSQDLLDVCLLSSAPPAVSTLRERDPLQLTTPRLPMSPCHQKFLRTT